MFWVKMDALDHPALPRWILDILVIRWCHFYGWALPPISLRLLDWAWIVLKRRELGFDHHLPPSNESLKRQKWEFAGEESTLTHELDFLSYIPPKATDTGGSGAGFEQTLLRSPFVLEAVRG
jgi:hypothetical protein